MKELIYIFNRLSHFFFNPSHQKYKYQIRQYTNNLLKEITKAISFITIFVWLYFAFSIDPKLHPEFPGIFYLRIGLSLISLIVYLLCFLPFFQKYRHYGLISIAFYAMLSCSIFTARLAEDSNYVSGYQILIMILAIMPVRLIFLYSIYLIGFSVFLISLYFFKPSFEIIANEYAINNFAIAIIFSFAMSYFLKKFRTNLFINHLRIMELKEKQDADYFLYHLLLKPFLKI
ncbi:MAG: hypothetical protein KDK36_20635, partial [Leptospiraceae bacterium]|nr:hypothetical protein [Leptospiraceae bacterium]